MSSELPKEKIPPLHFIGPEITLEIIQQTQRMLALKHRSQDTDEFFQALATMLEPYGLTPFQLVRHFGTQPHPEALNSNTPLLPPSQNTPTAEPQPTQVCLVRDSSPAYYDMLEAYCRTDTDGGPDPYEHFRRRRISVLLLDNPILPEPSQETTQTPNLLSILYKLANRVLETIRLPLPAQRRLELAPQTIRLDEP
jgi:hypothetical protein